MPRLLPQPTANEHGSAHNRATDRGPREISPEPLEEVLEEAPTMPKADNRARVREEDQVVPQRVVLEEVLLEWAPMVGVSGRDVPHQGPRGRLGFGRIVAQEGRRFPMASQEVLTDEAQVAGCLVGYMYVKLDGLLEPLGCQGPWSP